MAEALVVVIGVVVGLVAGVRFWRRRRSLARATPPPSPQPVNPAPPAEPLSIVPFPPESNPAERPPPTAPRSSLPMSLPQDRVDFEFIVLSRKGEPLSEEEFSHHLLTGPRSKQLNRDARMLLQRDCLTLTSERRRFVNGAPPKEPEIFRVCRHMANIGQINMAPTDHDLITIGRGAYRLRYQGPAAPSQAHLDLMVHAAETVRALRPGIVVDRHARQIWGEHSWQAQLDRHNGLGAREHFKIEMSQQRGGIRLSTRGLAKFGLPDLRMESLPPDLSGMGAISMTSIALDLIHAEGMLDPQRLLAAPAVRGEFHFDYQLPRRGDDYPMGLLRMVAGIDGEAPSELGLLEVLSRLRRRYMDGETFTEVAPVDDDVVRRAQEGMPRLKEKFRQPPSPDRVFLVRKTPEPGETSEQWFAISAIEGSTFRVLRTEADATTTRQAALDQAQICDWMILRGGDVEDGGFGLSRM